MPTNTNIREQNNNSMIGIHNKGGTVCLNELNISDHSPGEFDLELKKYIN